MNQVDGNTQVVTLAIEHFVASLVMPEIECNNTRFFCEFDERIRSWVLTMIREIPAQEVGSYKYPKTWWDAFKDHWFPRWLLLRYPATYEIIDVVHLYPEFDLSKVCGNGAPYVKIALRKGPICKY